LSILVFLGLSVLDLGPMYATDRQTSDVVRRASSLNTPTLWGGGHNKSPRESVLNAVADVRGKAECRKSGRHLWTVP